MSTKPAQNPSPLSQQVQILTIAPKETPVVCFLGALLGSLEHWDKKRSIPCLGEECPRSLHVCRVVFYAYAPGEVWNPARRVWTPCVIQATAGMEEQLRGRHLRGEVWSFIRADDRGANGPVSCLFVEDVPDETLTKEFDVRPVVCRCKGILSIKLGASNPSPNKVVLPEVLRRGPVLPDTLRPQEPVAPTLAELQHSLELAKRAGWQKQAAALQSQIDALITRKPSSNGQK